MTVIYGIISYILMITLIIAYFLVKKWGDRLEENSMNPQIPKTQFAHDQNNLKIPLINSRIKYWKFEQFADKNAEIKKLDIFDTIYDFIYLALYILSLAESTILLQSSLMRQNQKTRKEENQKLLQNREIHEQTRQQTIQRKKQEEKEREDEEFVTEKMRRRKIKNNEEEREASQNERERTREKKPQPSKKAKREHKKQLDGVKKRPVPSEQEMIKQPKKDQRVRSEEAFSKKKQEKDMVRQDEAAKRVSQLSKDASKKKVKKESNFEVQFATYSYDTALKIIQQLKTVYLKDVKANKNDEIAWHRIQHLPILRERLLNYEVKRVFLEKGGLEELLRWLLPTPHKVKNEEEEILIEPALAVKMAVLRILLELQLTPQQITEHGIYIHATLTKNQKNSKIPALRELCSKILRSWDFTMFKQLSQHFKNKSK